MHQKVIKQHQESIKNFSKSINSLRIITYINNKNDIYFISFNAFWNRKQYC